MDRRQMLESFESYANWSGVVAQWCIAKKKKEVMLIIYRIIIIIANIHMVLTMCT